MKKTCVIIFALIFVLLVSLAMAQQAEFDLEIDPAAAFHQNTDQAFSSLQQNPSQLYNPKILDAAFQQDPVRVSEIINDQPHLLDNAQVLERFNQEIIKDLSLINNNFKAKEAWLAKQFKIKIRDNSFPIQSYDGETLKTSGVHQTSFNPADFPEAEILENGCLQTGSSQICSSKHATVKENGKVFVYSGTVKLTKESAADFEIDEGIVEIKFQVTTNELTLDAKNNLVPVTGEETIQYIGSFTYSKEGDDEIVTSNCPPGCKDSAVERRHWRLDKDQDLFLGADTFMFRGTAKFPKDSDGGVIFSGDTDLAMAGASFFEIRGSSDVYYHGIESGESSNFCKDEFSCIVSTASVEGDPEFYDKLEIRGVKNGDTIDFKTTYYFSKVEVKDVSDGEFSFAQVEIQEKGPAKDIGRITLSSGNHIKTSGKFTKIEAGRFDVINTEDGTLHHWSSVHHQKGDLAKYFGQKNKFVTCTQGLDCEEKFARTFGKVLGPKNKPPVATIIIGGDTSSTAKGFTNFCKKNGCYILNSRDMPATTQSRNLIVAGHHYEDSDIIWRDPPGASGPDNHNPIDPIYFADLPAGDVHSLTFSACNTATPPDDEGVTYQGFETLNLIYPNLETVQGWNGIAPLREPLKGLISKDTFSKNRILRKSKGKFKGERAWYSKNDQGAWEWTNGKETKILDVQEKVVVAMEFDEEEVISAN